MPSSRTGSRAAPARSSRVMAGLLQGHRVLGPVLTRGRPAVARSVTGARVLDPQIGIEAGGAGVEPRRRPQGPARRITPLRVVGARVRAAAVAAGIDHGPGLAAEGALQLLAPG